MSSSHSAGTYQKARDNRKRPIRSLWVRNGRYYAQLTIEDHNSGQRRTRRVPLKDQHTGEPVASAAEAVAALERLKVQRVDNDLPVLRQTPKFGEYVDQYLAAIANQKRESTVKKEDYALKMWKTAFANLRMDQIRKAHVVGQIAKRTADGTSPRTVNLDVICLRNVLKHAKDAGWLKRLPTEDLRPLKWVAKKRCLVTLDQIENICAAGFRPLYLHGQLARPEESGSPLKNAQQFSDYLKLLAYSGVRMREGLRLKWSDVDWARAQLTIGSDGLTKNGEARVVDFNSKLEAHLRELFGRRAPDSEWIFPSPQRGDEDRAAKTFRESLLLARRAADLPKFGFHDARHFFVSFCVMSGIDFMTIARWIGHKDGGILIGKTYGHLANEHAQRQARRLQFTLPAENQEPDTPQPTRNVDDDSRHNRSKPSLA
jgi:integrase